MVNIYSQELSAVTHTRLLMKHFKAYGYLAPSFECVSAQTQPGVEQLLIIIDKGKWNTMLITAMSMQCITTAPVQLPCHCWLIHLCLCAVLSVVWLCVCVCSHVLVYGCLCIMNAVPVDKIPNCDIFDQIPWHWTTLYVAALNRAPEETGVKLY